MADIFITHHPRKYHSCIEYSLVDRRVRSFKFKGKMLYDEEEGVSREGWRETLIEFVKEHLQERTIETKNGRLIFL